MLITKVCPVCNKKFTAKHRNRIYCSEKCYRHFWHHHQSPPKPEFKVCPNCGKEFKPSTTHFQKYCCRECQIQFSEARKKELMKSVVRATVKCPICGKKFKPHRSTVKYCSKTCRKAAINQKNIIAQRLKRLNLKEPLPSIVECIECGKLFKPKSIKNICCSPECRHKRAKRKEYERERQKFEFAQNKPNRPLYNLKCEVCGQYFISVTPFVRFCSKECREFSNDEWFINNHSQIEIERFKLIPSANGVIEKSCKCCGKKFKGHIYGNNPFCSGKCERAYYSKGRKNNILVNQGVDFAATPPTL